MYPTPNQLRPIAEVTQSELIGLMNADDSLVGLNMVPGVGVLGTGPTGTYFQLGANFGVSKDLTWQPGMPAPQLAGKPLTSGTYAASQYGARIPIYDVSRREAILPADPEAIAMMNVIEAIKVDREKKLAAHFVSTNCGAGTKTVGGTGYNAAGSDPFGDIKTGVYAIRNATGVNGSSLQMEVGSKSWQALINNSSLTDRLSNMAPRHGITFETFSQLMRDQFGIRAVFVGDGIQETAQEGVTSSLADIWGDDIFIFAYNRGMASSGGPVLRNTFIERIEDEAFGVDTYRDEAARTDYLRAFGSEAFEVVNTKLCYGIFGTNP